MVSIHLTTFIAAPADRVFDLSRHLAIYRQLLVGKNGRFTSGAGSGLMGKGETLSFISRMAGKTRMTMLKVTDLRKPQLLVEEQVKGDLEHYKHEHHFKAIENGTILIDVLKFEAPKDLMSRIFGKIYFKKNFEELLRRKNETIRAYAETEKWRAVLM